jgi:hypothetical protein
MGYSMKMGSKQNNSPTTFKTKDLAMLMHTPGHKKGKIISIDTNKKVEKLPPKEGYITGGKKITRTITTRRGNSSSIPSPSGSKEFNIAFGKASKQGLKTFPFEGSIYSTEKAPNRKKSAVSIEKNTIVSTTGGIKANPINIKASVLDKKVPKPSNKIIPPPSTTPKKKKKRKKKFRNTDVGKFVRSIGDIQLPRLRPPNLRLRLGGGCRAGNCRKSWGKKKR